MSNETQIKPCKQTPLDKLCDVV